jgi:exocyst complex component 4
MSTLTSFLDEFLVNVFHPQLEEAVTELCTQSFTELDAFQEDPEWAKHSPKPIFKVITISFNAMLDC